MLLIKNCLIVSKNDTKQYDVRIQDGLIETVADEIAPKAKDEVIDAKGAYLLPGIIDLNVRIENDAFNIPNLEKLSKQCNRSGVTDFVLSPRFEPLVENQTLMQLLSGEFESKYPTLTFSIKALKDKALTQLNNIATLTKYDIDIVQENSYINGNLIRRIMQYAKMNDNLFLTFCENPDLNDSGVMHEGEVSFKLGMPGISKIGEISQVAKIVQMSLFYEVKTHFQALSTKESVDLISEIKAKFSGVSSEVSIHHLILDDSACDEFNTYAKLNPPLRSPEDKRALIQVLQEGKIDTLTSLHSPKSVLYKDVAFEEAMFGIDAVEDFMALCYTYLVKSEIISLWSLTELISKNPATILGLQNVGEIKEGYVANLMLFNPVSSKVCEDQHSPYFGETFYGCIDATIHKGRLL
ncbi:MAG: amidohydrolase family protein [Epsilonproteobacteria bacterium]|nr:amidohydrolase family protein [Campylobacterota bacterium]